MRLLTSPTRLDAGEATGIALLNCLVREISVPEHQVWESGAHLEIRLARAGVVLRAGLIRPVVGPTYRLAPPFEELCAVSHPHGHAPLPPGDWVPVDWQRIADLIAGELELSTGHANGEFLEQVHDGHTAMAALISAREPQQDPAPALGLSPETRRQALRADTNPTRVSGRRDLAAVEAYVSSEQALVAGHRFHPAPKARQGTPDAWLRYSPETGARFPLRWLALRDDLVAEEGDLGSVEGIGPSAPCGFRTLPVHPWQFRLLQDHPALRAALAQGAVRDLGPAGPAVAPTSSVRTVYVPDADLFCKFSLDVRITNCVRKNSWYELPGSIVLSELLGPIFAELGAAFEGCALLAERAYRTVTLADRRLYEGLSVIVRSGVREHPGTPLLAAALADPYATSPAALTRLLARASPDQVLAWWDTYVRLVAPPVLHAYLRYGVVLEPHLQNVLITVAPDGLPMRAIFRDLEGTKLLSGHWGSAGRDEPGGSAGRDEPGGSAEPGGSVGRDGYGDLTGQPPRVREALLYDADQGWNRVVYCLFVNHLTEIAAALADLHPEVERDLWRLARDRITRYAREHLPGGSTRLRALLAGVPLPAKANLHARWARAADRAAEYVAVPSPFREDYL